MDEFYLHLFSNASTGKNSENTLTKFKNDLPMCFEFPKHENWHVCVESIGFSSVFCNILVPDKNVPGIIVHSIGAQDEKTFETDIFFPSRYSDIRTIQEIFDIIKTKFLGLEFAFLKDKNIAIRFIRKIATKLNHFQYVLNIHENIVKSFGFGKSFATSSYIGDDLYYEYILTEKRPVIKSFLKRWNFKNPDIIKVRCDEITKQIFNSKLTNDLAIFCPSFEAKEKYSFYEFETEEYACVSNSILDSLSITLNDENDEQLQLDEGVASFVKLKFKKMYSNYNSFNIRIAPDVSYNQSRFEIDLPQAYYLDSDWKVALTTINYPNMFRPLPYETRHRLIWTASIGQKARYYELTNYNYSRTSLATAINTILTITESPSGSLTTTEYEAYDETRIKVHLHLNPHAFLMISRHVCDLLGYDFVKNENASITEHFVCFINNSSNPKTINFGRHFDINRLNPKYLMIYTDIIEQNIVGSTFAKLLKIVPVFNESMDNYKIQEFKHKEFHPLENTLIRKIKVEIRSHSGDLINFSEDARIFMNLCFST